MLILKNQFVKGGNTGKIFGNDVCVSLSVSFSTPKGQKLQPDTDGFIITKGLTEGDEIVI
jgi:hypothetical protein